MPSRAAIPPLLLALLATAAAQEAEPSAPAEEPRCPIPGAIPVDYLIQEGEAHIAHLWQLSRGGENAEGYWSFAGDRIVWQRTAGTMGCDRIFVTHPEKGSPVPVSNGLGVTTCAYFLPGDRELLFASTHGSETECPPRPDFSRGYVWGLHPQYDIWVHELATGAQRAIVEGWGYDAEATVSPLGDRIVFTSTRSGDLELWTCDLEGGDLFQVTDTPGYDGGAFFSHDGRELVFRATAFSDDPAEAEAERAGYRELLERWLVRPGRMELFVIDPDGENRRQLTQLGGANFAPFFLPDDSRIAFATNHHDQEGRGRNLDLFSVGLDGQGLERITFHEDFDSFPMFSPDGRYLAFSSNRGGGAPGETNLFVAEWRE